MNNIKKDARVWAGLLLLAVGLALSDRSFALWRNDQRNFAHANGAYPTEAEILDKSPSKLERRLQAHGVLATLAGCGLVLFVAGIVLLSREGGSFRGTASAQS